MITPTVSNTKSLSGRRYAGTLRLRRRHPPRNKHSISPTSFLNLLVAQLAAQSEWARSHTDFIGQMAQFSTLQQSRSMQGDWEEPRGQDFLQANGMLAKTVLVQISARGDDKWCVVSAVGMQIEQLT